jgi:hypothetical protein
MLGILATKPTWGIWKKKKKKLGNHPYVYLAKFDDIKNFDSGKS